MSVFFEFEKITQEYCSVIWYWRYSYNAGIKSFSSALFHFEFSIEKYG